MCLSDSNISKDRKKRISKNCNILVHTINNNKSLDERINKLHNEKLYDNYTVKETLGTSFMH